MPSRLRKATMACGREELYVDEKRNDQNMNVLCADRRAWFDLLTLVVSSRKRKA
jgi:hypothetical protein